MLLTDYYLGTDFAKILTDLPDKAKTLPENSKLEDYCAWCLYFLPTVSLIATALQRKHKKSEENPPV